MPLHPYFGTVLVIAILAGLCLIVRLAREVLGLVRDITDRKNPDAAFEAECRRLFTKYGADNGPLQ